MTWRRFKSSDFERKELPIRMNGRDNGKTVADYCDLYFPGHCPFLIGMQLFWDIEVND